MRCKWIEDFGGPHAGCAEFDNTTHSVRCPDDALPGEDYCAYCKQRAAEALS